MAPRSKQMLTFAGFLALPVIFFVAFFVYPIVSTTWISLHDWNGVAPTMRFIGLRNYWDLLDQPRFLHALTNNLSWLAFMLVCPTGLGLLLAALLDRGIRGEHAYRMIFFLPFTIPAVAVAATWRWGYFPTSCLLGALF